MSDTPAPTPRPSAATINRNSQAIGGLLHMAANQWVGGLCNPAEVTLREALQLIAENKQLIEEWMNHDVQRR